MEQILNGTSAQVGYTVPFTSEYAGKYGQKTNQNTDITKTKHNPEKVNNTKHSKTKLHRVRKKTAPLKKML